MSTLRNAPRRTPAKPMNPQPTSCVESLIRQLTAQAQFASQDTTQPPDQTQPEVLIDTEVDGVRCLLLRKNDRGMSKISFSPREREIARMVAVGHPNKMIAAVLEISSWTVCTHLRRIFAKLGVSSRAAMVARMIEHDSWRDPLTNEPQATGKRATNSVESKLLSRSGAAAFPQAKTRRLERFS